MGMWRIFIVCLLVGWADFALCVQCPTSEKETIPRECNIDIAGRWGYCALFCKRIRGFPTVTRIMTEIEYISIQESSIGSLKRENFSLLSINSSKSEQIFPNLLSFRCHYCKISHIDIGIFPQFSRLSFLSLSYNPFNMTTLENTLCGLGQRHMHVYLRGVAQETTRQPLSQTLLHCLRQVHFKVLDYTFNTMTQSDIHDLVCAVMKTVERLTLDYVTLQGPLELQGDTFECLNDTDILLSNLSLTNLGYDDLNENSFKYFSQIKYLDLSSSCVNLHTKTLDIFRNMDNLKWLMLNNSNIRDFDVFARAPQDSLKNLTLLDISGNFFISLVPPFKHGALPSLQKLIIKKNRFRIRLIPNGFIRHLLALETLILDESSVYTLQKYAFQSYSLSSLQMRRLQINIKYIPKSIFKTANKLSQIIMDDWNPFVKPTEYYLQILNAFVASAFQNITNLRHLRLLKMRVERIEKKMFAGSDNIETLDLSQNMIFHIEPGALHSLRTLRYLNIQDNNLKHITMEMLPEMHYNHKRLNLNLTLNAAFNPWSCDCELLWFRNLLTTEDAPSFRLANDVNKYTCMSPAKLYKQPLDTYKPEQTCMGELPGLYMPIVCTTFTALGVTLIAATAFRCRWHIQYIYINGNVLRRRNRYKKPRMYDYDAFIAYSRQETGWVVHELRPILEEEHKLKLCLHDRDWPVGVDIMENIQSSIERSRKVVLVITNAFAQSDWCQKELTMAQHQLFSPNNDNLVLLIKEPVLDCFMTPRLAFQMKSQTYLEWPESEMGQKVFWMRLVDAICASTGRGKNKPI